MHLGAGSRPALWFGDIEPTDLFIVQPKPVVLLPYEAAGVAAQESDSLLQRAPAAEVQGHLSIAEPRHGRKRGVVTLFDQAFDFCDEPSLKHMVYALVYAFVEGRAGHG